MTESDDELDQVPFDWLAEDLLAGQIIPFLGAGASVFPAEGAKPPSARALARELARESTHPSWAIASAAAADNQPESLERRLRADLDCDNLALVASWVAQVRGDRPRLQRKLRDALANPQRPNEPNVLHRLLASVARRTPIAIITTNYDDLIERALGDVPYDLFVVAVDRAAGGGPAGTVLFREAGKSGLEPVRAQDELLPLAIEDGAPRLQRTAVFKVHGHISRERRSEDTFVITEEDYVAFLGRMGPGGLIPADLVTLMRQHPLLFLGYGLRDWNLRVLLDALQRAQGQNQRSYAIARNIGEVDRALWEKRQVSIFNCDLGAFTARLDAAIAARLPVAAPA